MNRGGIDSTQLLEALQRLSAGDFGHRLERTGLRDERDLTAFLFNSIADEVQRIVAESTEAERRLSAVIEKLTEALTQVAAGKFDVEVARDGRGDSVDVLAYLVNNTIRELAILVEERERRAREDRERLELALDRRTRELGASEAAFEDLFQLAPVPLFLVEPFGGAILAANQRAVDTFGASCLGPERHIRCVLDPSESERVLGLLREGAPVESLTARVASGDGASRWGLVSASPIVVSGRSASLVSISDVSEHKQEEARLRVLADRDALTGALTRRPFVELASEEVSRCARYGRPLCLAMCDIDLFKSVNDTHGHDVGDAVLRAVGDALIASVRGQDLVARYGGEEFVVLLRETTLEGGVLVMERARAELGGRAVPIPGGSLHVTASVGVAEWRGGESFDALLRRADTALYAAKNSGRDRLCTAD